MTATTTTTTTTTTKHTAHRSAATLSVFLRNSDVRSSLAARADRVFSLVAAVKNRPKRTVAPKFFYNIALRRRNAITLSSPPTLPPCRLRRVSIIRGTDGSELRPSARGTTVRREAPRGGGGRPTRSWVRVSRR